MAGRSTRLMTRFFAHQSCTITIDISKPFKHNKTENNLPHRTPHKTATALARLDMGMQLFVRKKKTGFVRVSRGHLERIKRERVFSTLVPKSDDTLMFEN